MGEGEIYSAANDDADVVALQDDLLFRAAGHGGTTQRRLEFKSSDRRSGCSDDTEYERGQFLRGFAVRARV